MGGGGKGKRGDAFSLFCVLLVYSSVGSCRRKIFAGGAVAWLGCRENLAAAVSLEFVLRLGGRTGKNNKWGSLGRYFR